MAMLAMLLSVICVLPVMSSTRFKTTQEWKWPWQSYHPSSFPTAVPTTSLPTSAPSTSYPTYLPRYSSMLTMTIDGLIWGDILNHTILSRSIKMTAATIFDTTIDEISDLRMVVESGYIDSAPSSSPSSSPLSTYYVSSSYDDYDDYKYNDGAESDDERNENFVTIAVNVKSIYELDMFSERLTNRSDSFVTLFKQYAYNFNYTYGNYTGLWVDSVMNNTTTSSSSIDISSCSIGSLSSNTVAPTVSPTSPPTGHPTTPAPTCRMDTFRFIDIDYSRLETIHVTTDDGNVSNYNITTTEQYLHFFLLGDWGKGGNAGDITGEATYEPSAAPSSTPTSTMSSSSYFERLQKGRLQRRERRQLEDPDGGEGEGRDGEHEGKEGEGRDGEHEGEDGEPDHDHEDEGHDHEHEDEEHEREREHDQRTDHDDKTYQAAIAKQMSSLANDMNVKFVVALGDNFYDDGVESTTDSQWNTSWYDVYMRRFSNLAIPFYAVLGNHDYGSGDEGVQAQIDKTYDSNTNGLRLWNMPAEAYVQLVPLPDGGTILMINVDTTTLNPSANECCNEDGGVSTSEQAYRISSQLNSITTAIDCAMKDVAAPTWVVVSGHYPVYSTGEHADSEELIENLLPLFEEYEVDIYFSGHDHIAEHLQYKGVDYFIAGGGALTGDEGETSTANVQWVGAGFSSIAVASVCKDNFTIAYYNVKNELVYQYTRVKEEEVYTSPPTSYPSRTPTIDENNDDDYDNNFFSYDTALYSFYASCSALSLFVFAFFFTSAHKKSMERKSTQKRYLDLDSIDKHFKYSPDDDDYEERGEEHDDAKLTSLEAQSQSTYSPGPNKHSSQLPNPPSIHPHAHLKRLATSSMAIDVGPRYLTPTVHSRQGSRRCDYREQERLRGMGFTFIP